MRTTEHAILEAAIEWGEWQQAYGYGLPVWDKIQTAEKKLMDALAEHASETDGEMTLSEAV